MIDNVDGVEVAKETNNKIIIELYVAPYLL